MTTFPCFLAPTQNRKQAAALKGTSNASMTLHLSHGPCELALLPEIGGSTGAFTYKGMDILRPFPTAEVNASAGPLESAGFPLFPFSGRIQNGAFTWNGHQIELEPNFLPEPHTIHGQAWQNPWTAEKTSEASARMVYEHAPGNWPWAYRAEQMFELTEDGLTLTMRLTNTGTETMPAGMGWHPYFPRHDARLMVNVKGIWRSGEDMIPTEVTTPSEDEDLTIWREVDSLSLDNAFVAEEPEAAIYWPARKIRVDISADPVMSHTVVYTPKGQDFFCVEPVTHSPDAVNSTHGADVTGLQTLAGGETLTGALHLTVHEVAD